MGDNEILQDCIKNIFKFNPDFAHGYRLSGLLKLKTENSKNAYKDLKHSFQFNPSDPETLFWYFYILCFHLGRSKITASLLKKVLEIDPLTPATNGSAVWHSANVGDFENALKSMNKWYEMEPDSVVAAFYVGYFLTACERYEDAFSFIDTVCQKFPDENLSQLLQIFKYSLQKDKNNAIQLFTDELIQYCWENFEA